MMSARPARRYEIDIYGRMVPRHDVTGMSQPCRCRCGRVYDLGTVQVTARHLDCSVWTAPCCGAVVDDRGETGWKSQSDYVRLDQDGCETRRRT